MKKGSKPKILAAILIIAVIFTLGLSYVVIKLECEKLAKNKFEALKELDLKRNIYLSLEARVQSLSSAERIEMIAASELGMIKDPGPVIKITVEKDKISEINHQLNKLYE